MPLGGKLDLLDSGIGSDATQIRRVRCNLPSVFITHKARFCPGGVTHEARWGPVLGGVRCKSVVEWPAPNEHLALYEPAPPPPPPGNVPRAASLTSASPPLTDVPLCRAYNW